VLVGRARELDEVASVLRRARMGVGGLSLVTGEPGIGKTRLVEEVAARSQAEGFVVFWANCFEDEAVPAYWMWAQLLRSYAASTGDDQLAVELGPSAGFVLPLVPDLAHRLARMPRGTAEIEPEGAPGGEAARLPLFEAVVSVFRRAATRGPVLLVLDDLQWADPSSLTLLRFAAREVRRSPIAMVGTLRDVGAGPSSGWMSAGLAEAAQTVPLAGLSTTGVAALVEQASGKPPDGSLAAALRRQTGGNPLFVIELSRLLAGAPPAEGTASMPAGTQAAIERRLGALSPSCRSILVAASVIGVEFPLELLAEVTGAGRDEITDTLQESGAARWWSRWDQRRGGAPSPTPWSATRCTTPYWSRSAQGCTGGWAKSSNRARSYRAQPSSPTTFCAPATTRRPWRTRTRPAARRSPCRPTRRPSSTSSAPCLRWRMRRTSGPTGRAPARARRRPPASR
jgi:predicted ATPase